MKTAHGFAAARKQISREEFTMVMGTLKTEDAHDQMMDARELFKRQDAAHVSASNACLYHY